MDIQGLGLILTGIASIIGLIWTIYAGRRTIMSKTFISVDLEAALGMGRLNRLTRATSLLLTVDVWGGGREGLHFIYQEYEAAEFSKKVKLNRLRAVWEEHRLG